MINIEEFSTELVIKDGIFFSKNQSIISYPENGNEICFQIEENSFWFAHRNRCIIEAVLKYCPNNLFFDIGGGNGFVAKEIEANGVQTILVEPGIGGSLNAKKRGLKYVICSTLENASIKKNAIPSVGLFDVVEHIEKDSEFLRSIYDYLMPNGYAFITVPAFKFLWSIEDDEAGHYRRYSSKEIEQKLESVGFKIKYSTYIFSVLPIAVLLFRTIPSKLKINRNKNDFEKHSNQHKNKSGFMESILKKIWDYELTQIKKGNKIFVGGSCFVVAQKIK